MYTFLPMIKPFATACRLHDDELHFQRKHCLAILRAVFGAEECSSLYMKAWEGYGEALAVYSFAIVHEWRITRGYTCDVWEEIGELVGDDRLYTEDKRRKLVWPPWVGDLDIHRSHRSTLIAMNRPHLFRLLAWYSGRHAAALSAANPYRARPARLSSAHQPRTGAIPCEGISKTTRVVAV